MHDDTPHDLGLQLVHHGAISGIRQHTAQIADASDLDVLVLKGHRRCVG